MRITVDGKTYTVYCEAELRMLLWLLDGRVAA